MCKKINFLLLNIFPLLNIGRKGLKIKNMPYWGNKNFYIHVVICRDQVMT